MIRHNDAARRDSQQSSFLGFLISRSVVCLSIHVFFTPHQFPWRLAQLGQHGSLLGEFRFCGTEEGEIRLWVSERRL